MVSTLSSKQAGELHKSVIAYLSANNLPAAAAALRTELGLGEDVFEPATTKKYETLLEKKWTGVVRLQKKVMDLESRNQALQSELESATPTSLSKPTDPSSWLPNSSSPRYTLESHRAAINCIAFHPVFSSIASGSDDCTIKIWDWDLGELERTIKAHTRAVLDLDFGGPRGGFLLASCSSDSTIKLWDPSNEYNNVRTLQGHEHSVSTARFVSSAEAGTPASGTLLVSASRDQTIRIWDTATGYCLRTLRGHSDWVRDVCPSPDGRYLFSTGNDKSAILWEVSKPSPEIKFTAFAHENFNECCAFAPPSSYPHLAPAAGLKKPPPASSSAEFMATGSRDKTIRLWDARGICFMVLRGHNNWVRAIAFHPGGQYLLSVSDDKSLRCWDLGQEGRCVKVLYDIHQHFVSCLKWAPGIGNPRSGNTEANSVEYGGASKSDRAQNDVRIRCVIATGGVDEKLRIFAN